MIGKYKARVRLYESNIAELSFTVVDEKTGASEPKGAAKAEPQAPAAAPVVEAVAGEVVEEPDEEPAVSEEAAEAVEEDDAGEEE